MATVVIPPAYQGSTNGETEIEVEPGTVLQCIEAVDARYTGFKALVVVPGGGVHHFVKLFINGEQLGAADGLDQKVGPTDRLEVLSAIAGG